MATYIKQRFGGHVYLVYTSRLIMVVGRIIHEGYKISKLLLILCAHLFTDICDETEDSFNTCYC